MPLCVHIRPGDGAPCCRPNRNGARPAGWPCPSEDRSSTAGAEVRVMKYNVLARAVEDKFPMLRYRDLWCCSGNHLREPPCTLSQAL
jgi:hypothetical protein